MMQTSNARVVDFYARNPHISFEQANVWFVEIFETLFDKKGATESVALMNSQFSTFANMATAQMESLRVLLSSVDDSVTKGNHELKSYIMMQLTLMKREHVDDVKVVMENQMLTLNEKWSQISEKNSVFFTDKLSLVLNDQLPRFFHAPIREMHATLKTDLESVYARKDKNIDEFVNSFDLKYSNMLKSLDPVYNAITDMKLLVGNKCDNIARDVAEFTSKFTKNSSTKGRCSENLLSAVLDSLYPNGHIEDMSSNKASGDCVLSRPALTHKIMFENKNYERNVDKDEVEKFLRDVEHLRSHAVLVSQRSGISLKNNYQIEIHKGCIIVYVHKAEYLPERIQVAVDIIDSLAVRLQMLEKEENFDASLLLSQELMDLINDEYSAFVHSRENMSLLLRDFHKKMAGLIDDIRLPRLESYLKDRGYSIYSSCGGGGGSGGGINSSNAGKRGGNSNTTAVTTTAATKSPSRNGEPDTGTGGDAAALPPPPLFTCGLCHKYTAASVKSMSAHRRGCIKKFPVERAVASRNGDEPEVVLATDERAPAICNGEPESK